MLLIDTGEARFNTSASENMCDEEMLGWLKEGMSEYNLEKLRKRWRLAKGTDQDRWQERETGVGGGPAIWSRGWKFFRTKSTLSLC